MEILSKILNLVSSTFLVILLFFGLFTLASNSMLFGNYKSFLIQSGSMEPTIMTGDIIIIKQAPRYNVNDTVTFKTNDRIVTHRIMKLDEGGEKNKFITKGDANRSEDEGNIEIDQILGKVIFVIPKLGFVIHFARTIPGLILLLIVPALALIVDQIVSISKKEKNN